MSKDKKTANKQDVGAEIGAAIGKTEAFIEKYQKAIIYSILAVVLVVCGVLLFGKFYIAPEETKAEDQMAKGQRYFAVDSFQLAINGDGIDFIGFQRIIDNYGMTKSANLARAYTGISYYKLGEYQKAIDFLKKFKNNDDVNLTPVVFGLIGDSYVELNNTAEALKFFAKAYNTENIAFAPVYLKKAGLLHENAGEYDKAIDLYTQIKNSYFQSPEAMDIDKYIERAKLQK